ncbi:MAG: hypothetical protein ACK46D_06595, partial [Roseiflexaceae bacterium]
LMTAYSVCAGVGVVLVVVALLLTPRRPSTPVVLEPLPGTPPAHSGGNDGSTAPVAVELDTNAIPIGKVTGPLTPEDASATTDAHQFAATSQSSTSELDVTPSASKEPDTSSPSVGGDAQGR